MPKTRFFIPFLLALPFFLVIVVINLNLPANTYASPLAGFTPTPVPPGGGGDDDGDGDTPRPTAAPPTDYILVQLDQCDFECVERITEADFSPVNYHLLASTASDNVMLVPRSIAAPAPEIQVPVRFVHEGSGWIADDTISTQRSTRVSVPYPGRWEVLMIGQPRFITAEAVDTAGSNFAQLQAQLAQGPIPMGIVQANTQDPQLILCPIECVIQPTPVVAPPFLPETGTSPGMSPITAFIIAGLMVLGMGISAVGALRLGRQSQNKRGFF